MSSLAIMAGVILFKLEENRVLSKPVLKDIKKTLPIEGKSSLASRVISKEENEKCVYDKEMYIFKASFPIPHYDLYSKNGIKELGKINKNDIFKTTKTKKIEIITKTNDGNKWAYISYRNKKSWVLLENLRELAVCDKKEKEANKAYHNRP